MKLKTILIVLFLPLNLISIVYANLNDAYDAYQKRL